MMFEFGDELIIDTNRIPWLIWIQLLAMFLLVILLYYFTSTHSDLSLHFSTVTTTASPSRATATPRSFITSAETNTHQVRESEIKESGTSTSGVMQRKQNQNGEGSSGSGSDTVFEYEYTGHHPCNFFGFAKNVFLKCLGIDSTPDNSNKRPHEKND